jgi:SEC-C motif
MTLTTTARPGRNEPCHCGSGRKYKQCHLQQDEAEARAARAAAAAAVAEQPEETPEGEKAEAPSAAAAAAHAAARKPPTRQPWKKTNTHGFQRMSTPRKVGGG